MSKEEFLQGLRAALSGEVPQNVIQENIKYYDTYIAGEVARGENEESVIDAIGSPRLIARTIIDAEMSAEGTGAKNGYGGTWQEYGEQSYGGQGYAGQEYQNQGYGGFHLYNLNKWYWKLLAVFIVFLVIFLIVAIVGGVFTLLAPLVGPVLMVMMIMWVIRAFGRR